MSDGLVQSRSRHAGTALSGLATGENHVSSKQLLSRRVFSALAWSRCDGAEQPVFVPQQRRLCSCRVRQACSADWGINKLLNPLIIGNNLLLRLKGLDVRPIKLYGGRHVLASVAGTG